MTHMFDRDEAFLIHRKNDTSIQGKPKFSRAIE